MRSTLVRDDRPGAASTHGAAVATADIDDSQNGDPLGLLPSVAARPELGKSPRWLRFACWGAALLLGAFDAWYPRFSMSSFGPFPDAVAYIDIAGAYARGDWAHALNGYWSPLYSWLLAPALRLLHPRPAAEFPVVHLVNFLIFLAALASFDFLWRTWMADQRARAAAAGPAGWTALPPGALLVIGFTLFTWSALCWISVQGMSPDLLVAGLMYLAAGLTLRLRREGPRLRPAALLGLVLGLGFLAKAVMLPLAGVFLLVAFWPVRAPRRAAPALLGAGLAFLIVSAPFVYGLSRQQGHFTLGETGRLNYAWYVNGLPSSDWQGESPGHGTPQHPTRRLYSRPPVYEFAGPIGGTYPVWTDPSYWNAGVRARFDGRQQARTLVKNLTVGRHQVPGKGPAGLAAAGLLLLVVLAAMKRLPALVHWDLLLLSLAPACLYALVVVESRYLGASVVLFGLALLPAVRLPARKQSPALVLPITLGILLIPALGLARVGPRDAARRSASRADWETAVGLHHLGIQAGERVGCIGLVDDVGWARLARVTVVAHVPSGHEAEYWSASRSGQAAVLGAFARTGVRAVVATRPPTGCAESGWHRLGNTDRYARLIALPAHGSTRNPNTKGHAHG